MLSNQPKSRESNWDLDKFLNPSKSGENVELLDELQRLHLLSRAIIEKSVPMRRFGKVNLFKLWLKVPVFMTRLRERRGENAKNRRHGELEQVSISRKPLNRNDFCTKKLPNQEILYVTVDKFTEDHLCFYINSVFPSIYI